MIKIPFLASLTAHLSLPAWFKRRNKMDPQAVDQLLERILAMSTATTLLVYTTAAEKASDPQSFLDRFDVVWMWQLKQESSPFHEVCIFETEDLLQENLIRGFILERVYYPGGRIERTELTEITPGDSGPSTSHPPVSLPSPELSVGDRASLALVEASHQVSEALDKNAHPDALDRFLGEAYLNRYASWQCVRQIKPRGLKLFKLVLLSHVVHTVAPTYTSLKDNCFWYLVTIFDIIATHFGVLPSTPEDAEREDRYTLDPKMIGRWRGLKITASNPKQVSEIITKYNHAYTFQMTKIEASNRLLTAAQQYSETVAS